MKELMSIMLQRSLKLRAANKSDESKADAGGQSMEKKTGLCKGLQKNIRKILHVKLERMSVDGECSREISIDYIEEQILQKCLGKASRDLIILEHGFLNNGEECAEKRQALESLYEKLHTEVFEVVKESVHEDNVNLLSETVQAIVAQEAEDEECSLKGNSTCSNPARPRNWKQKWLECVELSVRDQMQNIPGTSPGGSKPSLSESFISLGKTIKTDLLHVVKNLKPHYPERFDVCNTYAIYYHGLLKSHTSVIAGKDLDGKDSHFVLCWVHDIYPNSVLRDPVLVEHIEETNLENLLPLETIQALERDYMSYEVESIKEWMARSLNMEVQRWKEGTEPLTLGGCYHSELHIDILQSFNGGIQRAAEINLKMSQDLVPLLANVLVDFLNSYKTSFRDYKEKSDNVRSVNLMNINCCQNFRDFVESDALLPPPSKEAINKILSDFQKAGFDTVLQDLFQELKVQFKKITQENGLNSHQTMLEILRIAEEHVSPLRLLTPSCYKKAIEEIHVRLVREYVTRFLKKKISLKNLQKLQSLSVQIDNHAKLISDFFSLHESQAAWLNPLIPRLAEIIKLQDVGAIQLEIAALTDGYPDIGTLTLVNPERSRVKVLWAPNIKSLLALFLGAGCRLHKM
uniref:Exocyst complex component 3 n=1 Tax=Leptobrachium leishanense TaxID=445787 RepID=A0A8C5PUS5_9ANUR